MTDARHRLRILFVSTSITGGGAEAQLLLTAKRLLKRGHTVSIVSLCDPEGPVAEFEDGTISFTSLGMQRGSLDLGALFKHASAVRTFEPDVVHAHMFHANLLSRLSRMLARTPALISTAHNFEEVSRWRNLVYRLTDPLGSVTTVVCERCASRFVERGAVPRSRVLHVPNGMDFSSLNIDASVRAAKRAEMNLSDDTFVWLAAGRLALEKDYPNLLRAVSVLRRENHSNHKVLLAGDGSLRAELEAQIERDGLREHVEMLGFRSDVRSLMAASDGFLMSSNSEGLPMVLLEAAAARLPSVVTDVGGNRELVRDGVTGFVVSPSNHEALAGAMVRLASLPKRELEQMGQRALDHAVTGFDMDVVVDRWESLYYGLVSSRHQSPEAGPV